MADHPFTISCTRCSNRTSRRYAKEHGGHCKNCAIKDNSHICLPTPLPECYTRALTSMKNDKSIPLPYTCSQVNILIEQALSASLSSCFAQCNQWKQEAFVSDPQAFSLWRTINARRIVGSFVTTLRRELSKLKETAIATEQERLGRFSSISRSNPEKSKGLWAFIDCLSSTIFWNTLIHKRSIGIAPFETLCKSNETWKSEESAKYYVNQIADQLREYLATDPSPVGRVTPPQAYLPPHRESTMPLPRKSLPEEDKQAGYIDSQIAEADAITNRLEAILNETRATNGQASEVSKNLISLATEANSF